LIKFEQFEVSIGI